ncbi:MAG TPA: 1,4-dihydroxy-2-naphthoate polyprenyltransferase [Steroidobacteraceae bacterium]|jgi:1,4-dihydroxy-2-naphthoate octaprenyltransferase|nr:1,4-dihydroxy-2-naphthoate polyprenyltransferase [Steroidobacteraceae bacterium]
MHTRAHDQYPGIAPPVRPWQRWWVASRPRTLAMAVTPVVAGACLAWSDGAPVRALVFALTLCCAVLIQAGTNLFNDVADHEKGNDGADRVGPLRITAAGWATPAEVRRAGAIAFGAALVLGLPLVWSGGPAILALGLCSIAAGWAYSGGTRPVSYRATGELFVLTFFGVVAVTGTYYLQAHAWSLASFATGVAVGAIAAAVLLVNNYRDLAPDAAAGRRTLASLLGPARSRALFAALMLAPLALPPALALASPGKAGAWLACLAAPLLLQSVAAMRRMYGPDLNAVLGRTALAQLLYGALLSIGVLL